MLISIFMLQFYIEKSSNSANILCNMYALYVKLQVLVCWYEHNILVFYPVGEFGSQF